MRVATIVLGFALVAGAANADAVETARSAAHTTRTVLAEGVTDGSRAVEHFGVPSAFLHARDSSLRQGAMGFMPTQSPPSFTSFGVPRDFSPRERFDPARIALPATRSLEDHLLTGFVALMLIAYQLRRKHRFLRPHHFST